MNIKASYIIIFLIFITLLINVTLYPYFANKASSINNMSVKTGEGYNVPPDINVSLNFKLIYPVRGYWARDNPWSPPLPSCVREDIRFYNEYGEEIKYTILKLNKSSNIGYMALNIERGSIVTVRINLTAVSYKRNNSTVYIFVDIYANLDDPNDYANKNITLYRALRGWTYKFIPSNLKILSNPVFMKLYPGESREVELRFKILNSSPQGIFPIYISIQRFLLQNGTLYWYGGTETPYLLIVS